MILTILILAVVALVLIGFLFLAGKQWYADQRTIKELEDQNSKLEAAIFSPLATTGERLDLLRSKLRAQRRSPNGTTKLSIIPMKPSPSTPPKNDNSWQRGRDR